MRNIKNKLQVRKKELEIETQQKCPRNFVGANQKEMTKRKERKSKRKLKQNK